MKERPIIFSTPMVKAILEGRKTMTRRVFMVTDPMGKRCAITSPDEEILTFADGTFHYRSTGGLSGPYSCPYGIPGDRLWVRETWAEIAYPCNYIKYKADDPHPSGDWGAWKSSRFMPKKYARIWLEVTGVRNERLQEITEEDAKAEGIGPSPSIASDRYWPTCRDKYQELWDSLHAKTRHHWMDANPFVYVLTFKRV